MTYQQPMIEKLPIMRSHAIQMERDNTIEELKLPISGIIQSFNKAIDVERKREEKNAR